MQVIDIQLNNQHYIEWFLKCLVFIDQYQTDVRQWRSHNNPPLIKHGHYFTNRLIWEFGMRELLCLLLSNYACFGLHSLVCLWVCVSCYVIVRNMYVCVCVWMFVCISDIWCLCLFAIFPPLCVLFSRLLMVLLLRVPDSTKSGWPWTGCVVRWVESRYNSLLLSCNKLVHIHISKYSLDDTSRWKLVSSYKWMVQREEKDDWQLWMHPWMQSWKLEWSFLVIYASFVIHQKIHIEINTRYILHICVSYACTHKTPRTPAALSVIALFECFQIPTFTSHDVLCVDNRISQWH